MGIRPDFFARSMSGTESGLIPVPEGITIGYRWDAEDYRQPSSQQKKWGRELLSRLALEGHERLLDLGCGDGKLAVKIAERLPCGSVHGIDKSEEVASLTGRTYPPHGYPSLSWEVKDASELDYHGGIRRYLLQRCPALGDRPPARPGWHQKKPQAGGRILVQMGGRGNAHRVVEVQAGMLGREEWSRYFADFSIP
ncbi:MAG: methyltransferase domain-containing protein [Actinomycetota bacterium]|nr:methyltransferase domain-containing protein [Actinomycetota bacterium]